MTSTIFKLSVLNTLLLTAFTTYAQDSETAAEVSKGELPTVYVTAERQVNNSWGLLSLPPKTSKETPLPTIYPKSSAKCPA